jgi:hypothetical protein
MEGNFVTLAFFSLYFLYGWRLHCYSELVKEKRRDYVKTAVCLPSAFHPMRPAKTPVVEKKKTP